MNNRMFSSILAIMLAAVWLTGCAPRAGVADDASSTHALVFRFKSAEGLHLGCKVKALGIPVGKIEKSPEMAPDGHSVLVTATMDDLSTNLLPLLNRRMTARIEKDNLVAGESLLVLYFSEKPAPRLVRGEITVGCDSFVELEAWKLLSAGAAGSTSFDRFMGLIFETDRYSTGTAVYWLNAAAFCTSILLIIALVLDFVLRVFQGRTRTRPSPYPLVFVWQVFALVALLKIVLLAAALIAWSGGFAIPDMRPWFIMPDNAVKLLVMDWRFLLVLAVLAGIRFKFRLLTLVVKSVMI